MCGIKKAVSVDASTFITNIPLSRSLAKVQFNLKIDPVADGFKILSVQLRNISTRIVWADSLQFASDDPSNPALNPVISDLTLIDYPKVLSNEAGGSDFISPTAGGDAVTFVWYAPRNVRGVDPINTEPNKKATVAPVGATYIEILALDKQGQGVIYRMYPGANNYNDFNLVPNRCYITNLNIKGGEGASFDSRIESMGDKTFNGTSNSYILNPPVPGFPVRTFTVPVTQVNRYWGETDPGYGKMNHYLYDDDEWQLDLLWQDAPNIVRENNPDFITFTKTGKGGSDAFSITVSDKAVHGNFVLALRKKADLDQDPVNAQILWSWHFWVTDYNPNPKYISIRGDKWVYPVTGGYVHRYGSKLFGYPHAKGNDDYSNYQSSSSVTYPYAKSVMMDRNVGYLNPTTLAANNVRGTGMYYQFGRKEPLPGNIPLYNITGTALATSNSVFPQQKWEPARANNQAMTVDAQLTPMMQAIYSPLVYFTNWYRPIEAEPQPYFLWADAKLSYGVDADLPADFTAKTGRFGKSIYDPCPEGWKMPLKDTFVDLRNNVTTNNANKSLSNYLYWPNDGSAVGQMHFPFSGHRDGGLSGIFGNNARIFWHATPSDATSAYYLFGVNMSANTRAWGAQARCVCEDE
jgi:hypothetical protein